LTVDEAYSVDPDAILSRVVEEVYYFAEQAKPLIEEKKYSLSQQ